LFEIGAWNLFGIWEVEFGFSDLTLKQWKLIESFFLRQGDLHPSGAAQVARQSGILAPADRSGDPEPFRDPADSPISEPGSPSTHSGPSNGPAI
jgi:hypothetical protein